MLQKTTRIIITQHDAQLHSMCLSVQAALQLQLEEGPPPPPVHIVSVARHSESIPVVEAALRLLPAGTATVECVSPPRLIAGWLVHMALGPAIGALLRAMVDEAGTLSVLPAAELGLRQGRVAVPVLVEACRAVGATAVGVVGARGGVRLLLSGGELELQGGDRVVVLRAEDKRVVLRG